MDIVLGVLLGIIVLTLLVVAHELGHALVARKYGVIVEEFGIGFPPKAWGKKLAKSFLGKDVEYSINWLPLGGFVRLKGEHDAAKKKGEYGAASFWQKTQILLAGVAVNWVIAAVLLSGLAMVGLPNILQNQFYVPADTQIIKQPVELVSVVKDLPADKAGLQAGDKILRFDSRPLDDSQALADLAKEDKGKTVEVVYSRQNVEQIVSVTLREDNSDGKGYLGASQSQQELIKATWSAPIVGIATTAQMSWATVTGIGNLLWNSATGFVQQFSPDEAQRNKAQDKLSEAGNSVTGPVGIFGILFPAAGRAGPTHVILLAAIISLTLAVINALPIPALDGGRWFVTALFKVLRKPLTKEREEKIHGIGFMVLMGLVVLITLVDIARF